MVDSGFISYMSRHRPLAGSCSSLDRTRCIEDTIPEVLPGCLPGDSLRTATDGRHGRMPSVGLDLSLEQNGWFRARALTTGGADDKPARARNGGGGYG
jgi:hypothetical protein